MLQMRTCCIKNTVQKMCGYMKITTNDGCRQQESIRLPSLIRSPDAFLVLTKMDLIHHIATQHSQIEAKKQPMSID